MCWEMMVFTQVSTINRKEPVKSFRTQHVHSFNIFAQDTCETLTEWPHFIKNTINKRRQFWFIIIIFFVITHYLLYLSLWKSLLLLELPLPQLRVPLLSLNTSFDTRVPWILKNTVFISVNTWEAWVELFYFTQHTNV